jgi:hypothetical protein
MIFVRFLDTSTIELKYAFLLGEGIASILLAAVQDVHIFLIFGRVDPVDHRLDSNNNNRESDGF